MSSATARRRPARTDTQPPRHDLCTPSAAITSGAANRRPSRAIRRTPCVVHRCLHDVRAGHELGARFDGQRHQQRIELDAADHHDAGPSDSTTVDAPSGPSRYSLDSRCVAMRDSAGSRYGKPLQRPETDGAPARLVSGKPRAIEQTDRDAGERQGARSCRTGGTSADHDDRRSHEESSIRRRRGRWLVAPTLVNHEGRKNTRLTKLSERSAQRDWASGGAACVFFVSFRGFVIDPSSRRGEERESIVRQPL